MEHSKQIKPTTPMVCCTLSSCIALYLVGSLLRLVDLFFNIALNLSLVMTKRDENFYASEN